MRSFLLILALLSNSLLSATPAPDFTVTTSDGQVRKLYQDYVNQQKVVVIEFFFVACPPCATHAPYLQSLYQSMLATHPGKVEFMLLTVQNNDTNVKVAQYLASKGLTMPAAGSDGGSIAAIQPYLTGQFGPFSGTPTFMIVSPGTGEVIFDIHGNSPTETMTLISQKISTLTPELCSIKSPFNAPLSNVQIAIDAPAFDTTITATGTFSLWNIPALKNTTYTLSANKSGAAITGVSTFDLVLISKHILSIEPFTQAWQLTAADFNCSGTITTFDIVVGRKLVLGVVDTLPCGAWKFLANPPEVTANTSCTNLLGIKIGDLNGPYFAPPPTDRSFLSLTAENRLLQRGETAVVNLGISEAITLNALQLAFQVDPAKLRINRIESAVLPDFGADCYNLHPAVQGIAPLVWLNGRSLLIPADAPLFTLEVTALQDGNLADFLTLSTTQLPPEMYSQEGSAQQITLDWNATDTPANPALLIAPNPAKQSFSVLLERQNASSVLLQLIDLQGKTVLSQQFSTLPGLNRLDVRVDTQPAGLYFLQLDGVPGGKVLLADRP